MRKTLTILTIVLFILFMVGCENSVNPINSNNPTMSIVQSDNATKIAAKPLGGEFGNAIAKAGPKGPKGPESNIWMVPDDFATIQDANDAASVLDGDFINVGPGDHAGALISKELHIKGTEVTNITGGPAHSSGMVQGFRFIAGSDGSSLSHLDFYTDLSIMNGAAVTGVDIHHNNFYNSIQAISNWVGSGWNIHHNKITDLRTRNGGGIGILVADYSGSIVENNIVAHNIIKGILHVDPADGGGYAGSGIVLYADFRHGWPGTEQIKNNTVEYNKVSLISDTPGVVDVVGFELTDTRDDEKLTVVIFDNLINKNDFRGTTISISLTPDNLGDNNTFLKNKEN